MKNAFLFLTISLLSFSGFGDYNQAQKAFKKKNWPAAARYFYQAYAYPKGQAERFKAEWGLAQSLQNLKLFYSASKYYSVIIRRGPGRDNPFFRKALDQLGRIDSEVDIGQSHIVQLLKAKIDPGQIPRAARGFYFYYLGVEAFSEQRYKRADEFFKRVPSSSSYYIKALFHLGVMASLEGRQSRAIGYFEKVRSYATRMENGSWMREQAILNISRIHYERRKFRESIQNYSQIPRDSENWLQAIFESAWAFFLMQKHNNTLGNIHTIHAPFFDDRFYPESYILQSVTFLRLCRFNQVKKSLAQFKSRYKPTFSDLKTVLSRKRGNPRSFFKMVYDYKTGGLKELKGVWSIFDALSRTDPYREAGKTIKFSDEELAQLRRFQGKWSSSGLVEELRGFIEKKKSAAVIDAGQRLYELAANYYEYLKDLSDQTQLINAEMLLGKVDALRAKLKVGTADRKAQFIGGLKELSVGQDLEYWPFEGEYWEDELGGYVYNLSSQCRTKGKKK